MFRLPVEEGPSRQTGWLPEKCLVFTWKKVLLAERRRFGSLEVPEYQHWRPHNPPRTVSYPEKRHHVVARRKRAHHAGRAWHADGRPAPPVLDPGAALQRAA